MAVQRIDQDMAVIAARALPDGFAVSAELRTRYRQLRVMLHSAGLAATYAFMVSKANPDPGADALARAYAAAERAIRERIFPAGNVPRNASEVFTRLGEMSAMDYARASAEAAAFTGWLSRLADAAWQASGNGGDDD
jgi:CRISPR/Cas system CMR-associated protein Cmr5 small subunit